MFDLAMGIALLSVVAFIVVFPLLFAALSLVADRRPSTHTVIFQPQQPLAPPPPPQQQGPSMTELMMLMMMQQQMRLQEPQQPVQPQPAPQAYRADQPLLDQIAMPPPRTVTPVIIVNGRPVDGEPVQMLSAGIRKQLTDGRR